MIIIYKLVLTIISIFDLIIIVHYFYLLSNKQEKLIQFLGGLEESKIIGIYKTFLHIGCFIVVFPGGRILFAWVSFLVPDSLGIVTDEGNFIHLKDIFAIIIAFASIALIESMEKLARYKVMIIRYEKNIKRKEQESLNQTTEKPLENSKETTETLFENEEKPNYDLKNNAARLEKLLKDYNNTHEIITTNNQNISNLDFVSNDVPYLIDNSIVIPKWTALEKTTNAILSLTDKDIENCSKPPFSINYLFNTFECISVIDPFDIKAAYSGNYKGGNIKLYFEADNKFHSYLEALTIKISINALIEGFYAAFIIPKKGSYWHGLYGHDYKFILNYNQLLKVLQTHSDIQADCIANKISRPCGIRFTKNTSQYVVSCLAFYPDGKLVDKSVIIEKEHIDIVPEVIILNSSSTVLY